MKTNKVKRQFLAVLTMLLLPVVAAATPATLSIEDFTISAGETKEMLIDLNNPSDEITLVQFDLRLPEGLSIATEGGEMLFDIAGRTTWRKHSLNANVLGDVTRFLLNSATNEIITGNSGAIISITLTASSSFNGGTIKLENQLLVTPSAVETKPADYSYTIAGSSSEPEPYAVLSSDGKTVTFYYDDQKAARGGIDIKNSHTAGNLGSPYGTAITAVFDASFANYRPVSTAYWFQWCSSLTTINGIENLKTDNVTDMSAMFDYCSGLTSLDVSGFNTSKVTNMEDMFSDCHALTSLDVSGFDTSKVTNMGYMFYRCSSLTSLDVSGFNTSNVAYMYSMFMNCSSLTILDVSGFNTSNVTDLSYMFSGCSGFTSIDVSGFETSNVKNLHSMFDGCSNLTTIYADEAKWNTASVTDSGWMFSNCTSLVGGNGTVYDANHIDKAYARIDKPGQPGYFTQKGGDNSEPYAVLSNGNTVLTFYYDGNKASRNGMDVGPFSNESVRSWHNYCEQLSMVVFDNSFANCFSISSTAYWFFGCSNLTTIMGISNLNTTNVTNMKCMFYNCNALSSLDVSNFNTSKTTDLSFMFYKCSNLSSLDVSNFNTSKVTKMTYLFYYCSGLSSLDVSNFNTSKVTEMSGMFRDCSGLTSLNVSNFDTKNVTNMRDVFYGCSSLTSLDLSNFDTSNVTSMMGLCQDCSGLTTLNVSQFNTSKVTTMHGMFWGCSNLPAIDLSHFDTGNVEGMGYMFFGCKALTSLDLSNFNTVKVTNMNRMFASCNKLSSIYAGDNWNTNNVTESGSMFSGCTSIVGGNGTVYDANHIDKAYARIDKPGQPGYFTQKDETGIRSLTPTLSQGEGGWYTLDGRMLQGKPTQKGMYIINGRKIVVK